MDIFIISMLGGMVAALVVSSLATLAETRRQYRALYSEILTQYAVILRQQQAIHMQLDGIIETINTLRTQDKETSAC